MEKYPENYKEDSNSEEISAEITSNTSYNQRDLTDTRWFRYFDNEIKERTIVGIVGMVLAILSLFVASLILAPISIITGYIAHRKGDFLGLWTIVIGVFSLFGTILLISFI